MPNPPGLLSSILEYQEGLCFFCRRPLPFDLASVDHLIPHVHGGFNHRVNLVACCRAINHFLGPIPFDLKVQLMADKLFMGGITRWCQTASARPDHAADLPHVPPYGGAAAGGWHGQTASHVVHHDKPSHDTDFLTE